MLARVLTQAEVAKRGRFHSSNLSRLMSGKRELTPENRRTLARVLRCSEADLHQPVGAPVLSPVSDPAEIAEPGGFGERMRAVMTVLGVACQNDLMLWLVSGDPRLLPPELVRRLREALEAG